MREIYPEKTFILAEDSSLNSTRGVVQTDEEIEIIASNGVETYTSAGDPASHTKSKDKVHKLFGGLLMIIAVSDENTCGSVIIKSKKLNKVTIEL